MSDQIPKAGEYGARKFWYTRKGTVITIGLTSVAIDEMGEITGVEFPEEGDTFTQGDTILTVEGTEDNVDVPAPASGEIISLNEILIDSPHIVFEDPTEEGWLVKIQAEDPEELLELAEDEHSEESVDEDDEEEDENDEDFDDEEDFDEEDGDEEDDEDF